MHRRRHDDREPPAVRELDDVGAEEGEVDEQEQPAHHAGGGGTPDETPPSTGPGIVWMSAPNFGEKPSAIAISAATTNTIVE